MAKVEFLEMFSALHLHSALPRKMQVSSYASRNDYGFIVPSPTFESVTNLGSHNFCMINSLACRFPCRRYGLHNVKDVKLRMKLKHQTLLDSCYTTDLDV